jgi:hypothetical protein
MAETGFDQQCVGADLPTSTDRSGLQIAGIETIQEGRMHAGAWRETPGLPSLIQYRSAKLYSLFRPTKSGIVSDARYAGFAGKLAGNFKGLL